MQHHFHIDPNHHFFECEEPFMCAVDFVVTTAEDAMNERKEGTTDDTDETPEAAQTAHSQSFGPERMGQRKY